MACLPCAHPGSLPYDRARGVGVGCYGGVWVRVLKGTHGELNAAGKLTGSPGSSTYLRGRFVCEVEWLCPVGHYCPLDTKSKVRFMSVCHRLTVHPSPPPASGRAGPHALTS